MHSQIAKLEPQKHYYKDLTELRMALTVPPGSFAPEEHFYPRALNAHMHPVMASFLGLPTEHLATRYCQINPIVDRDASQKASAWSFEVEVRPYGEKW